MYRKITKDKIKDIPNLIDNLKIYKKEKYCPKYKGIYFLMKDDMIIYIGKSVNIHERIFNHFDAHIYGNKEFNGFKYFECCDEILLDEIETILINLFDPYENTAKRYQKYLEYLPEKYKILRDNYIKIKDIVAMNKVLRKEYDKL